MRQSAVSRVDVILAAAQESVRREVPNVET